MNEGEDKKGTGSSNKLFSNETECLLVETAFSLRVQGRLQVASRLEKAKPDSREEIERWMLLGSVALKLCF